MVLVLVIAGLIGITLASYLNLASSQNKSVMYSLTWNSAMPMAEAGVEEALTHLTKTSGTNLAVDGWVYHGNHYEKTRTLSEGYYDVNIFGTSNFTIRSTGSVRRPDSTNYVSRIVEVGTIRQFRYVGLVTKVSMTLGGNMNADSYDSSDPLHSTNGFYNPATSKDNGFVATASQATNSSVSGSVLVKGKLATGPGGGFAVGGSSSVGDFSWSSKGVQPGHFTDDLNVNIPDVTVPFSVGYPVIPGIVDGTNYNYVLVGGNYSASSLSGTIVVTAPSALYVTGNIDLSLVRLKPGAKLELYAGGADTKMVGGSIANEVGNPMNLSYFGLPSNTSIKMGGNSVFIGTIYAPNADLTSSGTVDFYGALAVKTARSLSDFNYHYDENLGKNGPTFGMLITSWNEK